MNNSHLHAPVNVLGNKQTKDTFIQTQYQTIFYYLSNRIATASMVSDETGIPQKNICRYKKDLEKRGLLKEVDKKECEKTGFKAWYITTNPDFFPVSNQLKMF